MLPDLPVLPAPMPRRSSRVTPRSPALRQVKGDAGPHAAAADDDSVHVRCIGPCHIRHPAPAVQLGADAQGIVGVLRLSRLISTLAMAPSRPARGQQFGHAGVAGDVGVGFGLGDWVSGSTSAAARATRSGTSVAPRKAAWMAAVRAAFSSSVPFGSL